MIPVIAFFLGFMLSTPLWSQAPPPACDPDCDWTGVQQTTRRIELKDPDCIADITYRKLLCNGVWKYQIDGMEVVEGCTSQWGGLSGLLEQHKSYSALNDYLSMGLVSQGLTSSGVPNCTTGTYQSFTEVYTASCGIWVWCDYEINESAIPNCPFWDGPLPAFGTPKKVRVSKWQSCGTTCCKRVYRTCRKTQEGLYSDYTHIERVGPPVQVGPCTLANNYAPRQCESGCGE